MKKITICKLDHQGNEVFRYGGEIQLLTDKKIIVETQFMANDLEFHGMTFNNGDPFLETFYFDRWYNIFEIHDRGNGRLKGWYCNVGYPAEINGDVVSYRDLALDLLVFPGGRQIVLDEDEFEALPISLADKQRAISALRELQIKFKRDGEG
jgi:predicted RNA-binding protein associated with RNAse of E/G family